MMEEELIKIWQSSPNHERVKFEKARLMIDVQSGMDRFHRKIKYRDLREQIAVIIVIPAFVYAAWSIPYIATKIASVLIIAWGIYVVIRLRNARKHKPGAFTETYMEYLYKTREYLGVQKYLLDSIFYWYIIPGFTLVSLFLAGFMGVPGKTQYIIRASVANALLAVAVYFLNKRAVSREIVPRLQKVTHLIELMEKP